MKTFNHTAIQPRHHNRFLCSAAAALVLAAAGPALAQQQVQEDDQLPEAVTMNQDLAQEGADVLVNQAAPTIIVQQPKPKVTVTLPPPDISIRQPAPTIRIIMPEPEVTIDQAQPQVKIEMPEPKVRVEQAKPEVEINRAPTDVQVTNAKPNVQIESGGEPEVQIKQTGRPTVRVEQAKPKVIIESALQQSQGRQDQSLMSMTGDEIVGQELMSSGDQPLGKVSDLVVDKQSKQLFAVVEVGDAVSGDVSMIVVPLQQIQLAQDQLKAGMSPQQITPDMAYKQGRYQPIQLGVPLQEYAVVGQ